MIQTQSGGSACLTPHVVIVNLLQPGLLVFLVFRINLGQPLACDFFLSLVSPRQEVLQHSKTSLLQPGHRMVLHVKHQSQKLPLEPRTGYALHIVISPE